MIDRIRRSEQTLTMTPLHCPNAARALCAFLSIEKQREGKTRMSYTLAPFTWGSGHAPACAQTAGQILSAMTQDDERHATFFCRKGKASQRHKIELFRMAPRLEQNGAKAAQRSASSAAFNPSSAPRGATSRRRAGSSPKFLSPGP